MSYMISCTPIDHENFYNFDAMTDNQGEGCTLVTECNFTSDGDSNWRAVENEFGMGEYGTADGNGYAGSSQNMWAADDVSLFVVWDATLRFSE